MLEELSELFALPKLFIAGLLCIALAVATFFFTSLPFMLTCRKFFISLVNAFGAGLMVGAALTVVIPESIEQALESKHHHDEIFHDHESHLGEFRLIGICLSCGFILMLIVDALSHKCMGHSHDHGHDHGHEHEHEHASGEACDHDHHDQAQSVSIKTDPNAPLLPQPEAPAAAPVRHAYVSTVIGLCLHSIFDGVAVGASLLGKINTALTIFFAIAFHKMAASFALGAYLRENALSWTKAVRYTGSFSLVTPVATFLIALAGSSIPKSFVPIAFSFSGGTFLYVAITHILPAIGKDVGGGHIISMVVGLALPYILFRLLPHEH